MRLRLWKVAILIAALVTITPLAACEYLGLGGGQRLTEEQIKAYEEYNKAMKEYQEQQEEYRKRVIEEYYKQLAETYKEYGEGVNQYYDEYRNALRGGTAESANKTE